eukprot:6731118-Alexandrium_andersonii.AAC.1
MRTRFGFELAREREHLLSLQPGLVQPTGDGNGPAASATDGAEAEKGPAQPGPLQPASGGADGAAHPG